MIISVLLFKDLVGRNPRDSIFISFAQFKILSKPGKLRVRLTCKLIFSLYDSCIWSYNIAVEYLWSLFGVRKCWWKWQLILFDDNANINKRSLKTNQLDYKVWLQTKNVFNIFKDGISRMKWKERTNLASSQTSLYFEKGRKGRNRVCYC